MTDTVEQFSKLTLGIRRCFWLLAAISDDMLDDLGLTASLRAVLEHLDESGPSTVPHIARTKAVKRQSIQVLVDQLREHGLVESKENPAHRRSRLICLTSSGREVFDQIKRRERDALSALLADLDGIDLSAAAEVLARLQTALRSRHEKGTSNNA